jgi:ABC-type Fe3+/spermidine/putrescine transport system ATPase subunit
LITILLADDQALIRSGIRSLLEAEDDIEVVAEAADGRQAVTLAVRPERMRLERAPAEAVPGSELGWNTLAGVVRELVYTGSDTQYFVELGQSGTVMVRGPNDAPPEIRPARGDRVWVRWEVGGTTIVTA